MVAKTVSRYFVWVKNLYREWMDGQWIGWYYKVKFKGQPTVLWAICQLMFLLSYFPCISLVLTPCLCFGFKCLYSDTYTENAAASSGRKLGPDEWYNQATAEVFIPDSSNTAPQGDDMLSWSFIVMQRDEAYSQTAQSVKRLIFQIPLIKNHCGSDWVTIAGEPDSPLKNRRAVPRASPNTN